ncbi:MAG: glycosyltransferase family 2 protein [Oscillospiraceae bacterium]|jgi:glycosyltransferase involved in cell wall biosynthesis|nr:glycosyltransferase family 2 protein [Oscillospiraceae bacterium]
MRRNSNQYHGNKIANRARRTEGRRGASEPVRLSQCMIVKNEERNIERALSWAKEIAFERIVVDTGSTDRTVEIAESMGAKVFHFEWIDDFAAAKNYAIEKARGNWIAFLDADEYFTEENAKKVIPLIDEIKRRADIICCELANLDDDGNPFAVAMQNRIFRNTPGIRYIGAIHEALTYAPEQLYTTNSISILHTGYTSSEVNLHDKSARNVAMLRAELEKRPDDANLKGYLAQATLADKSDPGNVEKAKQLYQEVLDSGQALNSVVAKGSHDLLISWALNGKDYEEVMRLCGSALKMIDDSPDYNYWHGVALYCLERYDEAWEQFTAACTLIENATLINTKMGESGLANLFEAMALTAKQRGDDDNCARYMTMFLKQNKYESGVCEKLIALLRAVCGDNDREIIDYLRGIYDFGDAHDKLFLAKCSKEAKDLVLTMAFHGMITPEEKAALAANPPLAAG